MAKASSPQGKASFLPNEPYLISDEKPDDNIIQLFSGVIPWDIATRMMITYQNSHPKLLKRESGTPPTKIPLHALKVEARHLELVINQNGVKMDEIAVYFAINHKHLDRKDPLKQDLTVVFIGMKNNVPYRQGIAVDYCEPIP